MGTLRFRYDPISRSGVLTMCCWKVKGEALSTHKYLLQRFSKLKDMVTANSSTGRSRLALEDAATVTPDDFRHTFKMLYAS